MKAEEQKQLLLKDLSARLPYWVKLRYVEDLVVKKEFHTITLNNVYLEHIINGDADIKPYLRPMESMTEEEMEEYNNIDNRAYSCPKEYAHIPAKDRIDWLNAHHFDYRGLIPMGLALPAKEGMYNN